MLYWTVKIGIDESWVADGLEITEERLHEVLEKLTFGAYPEEISVQVLDAPDQHRIRVLQGYEPEPNRGPSASPAE